MIDDKNVTEVREVRQSILKECDYDLKKLYSMLLEIRQERPDIEEVDHSRVMEA